MGDFMEPVYTNSEAFSFARIRTKENFRILFGFIVAFTAVLFNSAFFLAVILRSPVKFTIGIFFLFILCLIFFCGYLKNIFQALDGIRPTFAAYGQEVHKMPTLFMAFLVMAVIVTVGAVFFIIPGFYLLLRLQFFAAFIIEEDAGITESLKRSWSITNKQIVPLIELVLAMAGVCVLGIILFFVGIFIAIPVTLMMYAYVFRKLKATETIITK